jgi:hypothetical protein
MIYTNVVRKGFAGLANPLDLSVSPIAEAIQAATGATVGELVPQ